MAFNKKKNHISNLTITASKSIQIQKCQNLLIRIHIQKENRTALATIIVHARQPINIFLKYFTTFLAENV